MGRWRRGWVNDRQHARSNDFFPHSPPTTIWCVLCAWTLSYWGDLMAKKWKCKSCGQDNVLFAVTDGKGTPTDFCTKCHFTQQRIGAWAIMKKVRLAHLERNKYKKRDRKLRNSQPTKQEKLTQWKKKKLFSVRSVAKSCEAREAKNADMVKGADGRNTGEEREPRMFLKGCQYRMCLSWNQGLRSISKPH